MITHILQTFSKVRYRLTSDQASTLQDVLDHKNDPEVNVNDFIIIGGGRVHIGSIEGIHPIDHFPEEMHADANHQAYQPFKELPEPGNRFTHQQNIQRMREAAYKAKKAEQEKHGIQSWSTPLENWLPERYAEQK